MNCLMQQMLIAMLSATPVPDAPAAVPARHTVVAASSVAPVQTVPLGQLAQQPDTDRARDQRIASQDN